ncbi:hypothetical protein CSAL01_11757 [Colletotrichum salicis]|uniref:Uncharacterized protein n=1 Tax=Colletotrichum salicis TaxID=1209931 RepID=A0A135V6U4_9PEZI|nr:hypothetical protein CSAL01_11757 [Colletotrichum salicis]
MCVPRPYIVGYRRSFASTVAAAFSIANKLKTTGIFRLLQSYLRHGHKRFAVGRLAGRPWVAIARLGSTDTHTLLWSASRSPALHSIVCAPFNDAAQVHNCQASGAFLSFDEWDMGKINSGPCFEFHCLRIRRGFKWSTRLEAWNNCLPGLDIHSESFVRAYEGIRHTVYGFPTVWA